MPIAAIFFDFDPTIVIGDRSVTLWSLAIVVAVVLSLACAAFLAGRADDADERLSQLDLWMIVLGIVPGAVIGGRLGYIFLHLGFFAATPSLMVDVSQGAFQLSCAVIGGALTGAYVARVIEAPVGRWLHVAALPALGVIVIGKLGMALGGAGQGQPSAAAWATAYLGPGPWGSLGPTIPSLPSQIVEAGATYVVLLILLAILAAGRLRQPDGTLFLVAVELWLVARFLVAFGWRDAPTVGPLCADQVVSLALLAGCLAVHVWWRRSGRAAEPPGAAETPRRHLGTEWRRPPDSQV